MKQNESASEVIAAVAVGLFLALLVGVWFMHTLRAFEGIGANRPGAEGRGYAAKS